MYLPTEDALYFAQAGHGAYRNDQPVRVTSEKDLQKLLCTFGFDPEPGKRNRKRIKLLFRLSGAVRNTRTTNSLVDFCYTIDGRFGGCVNLKTKIWDIVPVSLILPEAGGRFTDLAGKAISFELGATAGDRDYPVLGAARQLHSRLVALTQVGKR
jgi:myo-inositol-1(or 4)-monophosphatase